MREILFRGKSIYTGKWAVSVCPHGVMRSGHLCDDFIPDTVGQFTGRKDKNGKKIFEGDVCRFYGTEGYSDYVVFWDDTVSQWTVRQIDLGAKDVLDSYFAECCEVIGNIHDNPELLGGGEDG